MLKGRSNRAVISEVPFMYGKDTYSGFSWFVVFVEVVGLLLCLVSTLLIKCTG